MKAIVSFAMVAALAGAIVWAQTPAQAPAGQAPPKLAPGAKSAGFEGSAYGKARDIEARIVSQQQRPAV